MAEDVKSSVYRAHGFGCVRYAGRTGDTHTWSAPYDIARLKTSHIAMMTEGEWAMVRKPPSAPEWPRYVAGMHSDMLPDIVKGEYQYVCLEPTTVYCFARVDADGRNNYDFEYLYYKIDAGSSVEIPLGRLFFLGIGGSNKGDAPMLLHAKTKPMAVEFSAHSIGIMMWAS